MLADKQSDVERHIVPGAIIVYIHEPSARCQCHEQIFFFFFACNPNW